MTNSTRRHTNQQELQVTQAMQQARKRTRRHAAGIFLLGVCCALVLGSTAVPSNVFAQAASAAVYPDKSVTMVVNFGPGGVTDLMSRELARAMEIELGKQVIVFNRPGALGTLGPTYVAKQAPDGYTLAVVSASGVTITPHLMDVSDDLKDLQYVAGFGINRYGLVVRADSPYKTLDDLIAKSKGEKSVFFGSPSTPNSLILFDLGAKSKGKFELIAYKSGPDATLALMSGQVEVIAPNPPEVMGHIQTGSLRLLASASSERWPEFPDVPTMKESGFDVGIDSWVGIAVPKGTPQAVMDKIEKSIKTAVADPELQKSFLSLGAIPSFMPGRDYTVYLANESKTMAAKIAAAAIPRIK